MEHFNRLIVELNASPNLWIGVARMIEDKEIFSKLTIEQQVCAIQLKTEFEAHGVHFPDKLRNQVAEIQGEIHEATAELERSGNYSLPTSQFNSIIQQRQNLANLLNEKSYAHLVMKQNCFFVSPESALQFLKQVNQRILPAIWNERNIKKPKESEVAEEIQQVRI